MNRDRWLWVGCFVALLFVPLVADGYQEDVMIQALSYALFATGLNVVVGLAGLLDLGYVAFWAIGAYSMAILSGAGPLNPAAMNMWEILPFGILAAMLFGVVLGLPVLRLRGDYLAIVTLGFGEIIRITAANLDGVTGGAKGISGIPHPTFFTYEFGVKTTPYYFLAVAALAVALFAVRNLKYSRIGRAWIAVREDETAAEAMGVDTFKVKLWAFAIGASTAGAAGVINASRTNFVGPNSFLILTSILVLSMVVLGGMGSLAGPVIGALLIVIVPEALRDFVPASFRFMVFGAVLVVMMIFRPQGIVPSGRRAAELHQPDPPDTEHVEVTP